MFLLHSTSADTCTATPPVYASDPEDELKVSYRRSGERKATQRRPQRSAPDSIDSETRTVNSDVEVDFRKSSERKATQRRPHRSDPAVSENRTVDSDADVDFRPTMLRKATARRQQHQQRKKGSSNKDVKVARSASNPTNLALQCRDSHHLSLGPRSSLSAFLSKFKFQSNS